MLKVFLTERLEGVHDSLLLNLLTSQNDYEGGLFQKIKTQPFKSLVEFVDTPEKAEYLMMPHNYSHVSNNEEYISRLKKLIEESEKKVILFEYGDNNKPIIFDDAVILRTSAYKSSLRENEIVVPAFVEDLGEKFGVEYVEGKIKTPTIGFTGWVRYESLLKELKYKIKVVRSWIIIVFGIEPKASYQGIFYRRKIIKILQSSQKVKTLFNLRKSYSGNVKTIKGGEEEVRKEYIDSIKQSDLCLSVRGDGNWSLRFYEVLSLGRIPLYVDTDTALPFEDEIDYDSFIIRVDHKDFQNIADITASKWAEISDRQFVKMQKKAREIFETKLRTDVFYSDLFKKL